MATIGNTALTYADWAKRMDDNYRVAMIIELLSQTRPRSIDYKTSHVWVIRISKTERSIGNGCVPSKNRCSLTHV